MASYYTRRVHPEELAEDPERIAIRDALAFGKAVHDVWTTLRLTDGELADRAVLTKDCLTSGVGVKFAPCLAARCNAIHMREYAVDEPEGAQGYGAARIGLRAPRVAMRVETGSYWQSMFGLAMWVASSLWGGYGFVYLPRGSGALHPALARILTAYDPDYLVDAQWTHGDVEALEPGWHARRYRGWPADPEESVAHLRHLADMVVSSPGEDIGADRCSPFFDLLDATGQRECSGSKATATVFTA